MTSPTQLQSLLEEPVAKAPHKFALRVGGAEVSYVELEQQMRRVAAGLKQQGINHGDRVAWFLPNTLEAVLTTLACYRIGAISLPVNYRYMSPEVEYVLRYTGAQLLIFHDDRREVVEALPEDLRSMDTYIVGAARGGDRHEPFESLLTANPLGDIAAVREEDPALILFTSGSTGRPKGVVHSHVGCFTGIDISRRIFDIDQHDVVLVGKPISHAGGLQTQLLPTLQASGEVVLAMKPKPDEATALIAEHGVTQYALLASDLLDFIEYLEANPRDLPSLKNSIGSGDAVPHDLHHRFRDLFGWQVMEGCGMTEIGGYYAVNPRHGVRKWGSMGPPAPDTEIRLMNHDGAEAAVDEVGEILVHTPSATIGYWQNDAATAELFRDGWLHSGDLARRDVEGYLWFVGRKKLMIIRRGSNIAPAEIEDIIDEHPKVHASVVVGVPDASDGHVPVACVAPLMADDAPEEGELREFVAAQIAAYKVPVRFLLLPELPRNSTGKFDRHRLEEIAADATG